MSNISNFNLHSLKGDFMGGITAGVIGLPLCLAFGATSGLGAIAGLYGGIALGIVAALSGGSKTQCSAPTGPMTVVSALIIAEEIKYYGSLESAYGAIAATFVLAGAFQVLLGVLKLGNYINYLPYSVISGFMSGIGIIVVTMQFPDFFGAHSGGSSALEHIFNIHNYIYDAHWENLLISSITLVTAFGFPLITKLVPSTLVAIVVGTGLTILLGFDINTIGTIPKSLPDFKLDDVFSFDFTLIGHILIPAISLGALGMVDSLLTAVVIDKQTKTKHNSNRELIGQGLGNICASLVGGLPGAGTTVVSVANTKAGANTRMSGVIQSLFLIFVIFVGGSLAAQIPYAVLAGLLVYIGINIIDRSFIQDIKVIPKSDLAIILMVFILTIVWNLLYATAIGFTVASIFFMKKMADTIDEYSSGSQIDLASRKLLNVFENANEFKKDIYIKQLNGPVFFGFASRIEKSIAEIPDIKSLILDMTNVPHMDLTGMYSLRDTIFDLRNKNINIYFSGLNQEIYTMLKGIGVLSKEYQNQVFGDLESCVLWLHDKDDTKNFDKSTGIHIPSAFSPNEDGANDDWMITGLEKYDNCEVTVKTKDEKIIYHSIGYNNPWVGKFDGNPLPAGTYFYEIILKQDNKDIKYEGSVYLIR